MPTTVQYNGETWIDHGVSSHGKSKAEALKSAAWMRKGGFRAAIVKRADGWHYLSRAGEGEQPTFGGK